MKRYTSMISVSLTTITLVAFSADIYKLNKPSGKPIAANTYADYALINTKELSNFPYIYKPFDDFYINVDSRFIATISKEKLQSATTVIDLVPADADWSSHPIQIAKVTIYEDSTEKQVIGAGGNLNKAQVELLGSIDYADNFSVTAICVRKNEHTGIMENYELVYYISVTPETQAIYLMGKEALNQYLKENSRQDVYIASKDKLQGGRILFTVTREGTIDRVKISSSCGYNAIDAKMLSLISNIPGLWEPAKNAKGDKIDQQLVLFFGTMGC